MYVDETGTPDFKDSPRYFSLTGVIVHESDIKNVQKTVFDFKQENFSSTFTESEIHMHDIFKSKKGFVSLRGEDRRIIIDGIYKMIEVLPIKVISTAINKPGFQKERPSWKVLKTAFIILVSRYNHFLKTAEGYSDQGIIRMDKTNDKQRNEIYDYVEMLRKEKKYNQIDQILDNPYFVNSDASEGIQIADAISFCIGKKLLGNPKFPILYWDLIKKKILANSDGKILGFGLNVFPYMKELESEDIQP